MQEERCYSSLDMEIKSCLSNTYWEAVGRFDTAVHHLFLMPRLWPSPPEWEGYEELENGEIYELLPEVMKEHLYRLGV